MAGELGSSPGAAISHPQQRGLCCCCFTGGEPKAQSGGVYREISSIPTSLSKFLSPGAGSRILGVCTLYKSLACLFHSPLLAPWGWLR